MNWQLVAFFAATELVLCLTPGPAVLTILAQALHSFDRAKLAEAKQIATNTRDTLAAAGHPDDAFFSQYMPLFDKVDAMLPK